MRRSLSLLVAVSLGLLTFCVGDHAEAQRRRRRPTEGQGTLTIQASQPDAEILIDEQVVGVTPLEEPIRLDPGSHTVRIRRPGYTELTDVVVIRAGQNVDLPVDLMALSMVLTVRTEPEEARVFVDGAFRGATPIEVELVEGEHSVRVTHPTHREVIRAVNAIAGRTELIQIELEPLSASELGTPRATEWFEEPVVWISVGGGAALAAVVIVLVVVLTQGGGSQIDAFCGGEATCIRVAPEWQF